MTERIVVSSADDAWALLRAALDGKALPDRVSLVFDGWPRFQMKVSGRDWHGTVPTRIMAPLLDVQRDLYRAYANVCYGDSNLRRLRDEDRELLELVLKVDEGSSEYEAPLYEQLTELARKAIDKMDARSLVITILGIAVVLGGVEINKAWVAERQDANNAERSIALSKQETERLKIFATAMRRQPLLSETREDFEATQNRLLKSVKPGDTVVTKGVALDGDQVAEITQGERARAEDIDISGVFRVLANDASKGAGFRIKVSRVEDGLTFSADVPIELDADAKRLIQKAEWSKGAVLVELDISASSLRGGVMNAVVNGASAVP